MTGRQCGELTVLEKADSIQAGARWLCRCDCGKEVEVSYNGLQYGNRKSCGCRKKEHEQNLKSFLTHVDGTSIDMLKSKKIPADNTTGYREVYYIRGKYVAKIVFRKKQYILGSYDSIEAAAEDRREAESVLFDGVSEHYRLWKEYADKNVGWAAANPVQVFVDRQNGKLQVVLLPQIPK